MRAPFIAPSEAAVHVMWQRLWMHVELQVEEGQQVHASEPALAKNFNIYTNASIKMARHYTCLSNKSDVVSLAFERHCFVVASGKGNRLRRSFVTEFLRMFP